MCSYHDLGDSQEERCVLQGETADAVTTKVLLVKEASQEFVFTEVPEKPVLSALRNFSAPVKLQVGHLVFLDGLAWSG